jgi:membrane fusion protein, copper/silver efflux system
MTIDSSILAAWCFRTKNAVDEYFGNMKYLLTTILFLALLAGGFLAGSWYRQGETAKVHPQETKSPSVSVGAKHDAVADTHLDASALPPGTVRITPDKQQMVGVRTGVVEKGAVEHFIRTVGRVAPDEKRVYRLVAGADGWIRETYNNDTGTLVKKDERLASFYSPLFRNTQLSYLAVLGSPADERYDAGRRQALAPSQLATVSIKTYVDALESLGMSEQQIKELADTRQVMDKVFIMAPATGFIIARNVSPGQRFDKGFEWYRIADLSKVWILADLFVIEAADPKPGMKARVTLPDKKKDFHAVVAKVLPQFDSNSRTMKVRLELENPGFVLRPDMFVDVEFPLTLSPALTVPADAILDSGLRKTVFVDRGNGFFEPRQVETGWRHGNRVEVTKGLEEGERIVISGNFLIDSESRLQAAGQGIYGAMSVDLVCGMEVDELRAKATGKTSVYRGKTYYFCTEECKEQFDKEPGRFVDKSPHKQEKSMSHTRQGAGHD